jgi:hypothetical protein
LPDCHLTLLFIIRMAFVPASLRKLKSIVRMENTGADDIKATLAAADVPLSEADCRRCPDPCEEGVWLFLEPPFCLFLRRAFVVAPITVTTSYRSRMVAEV